MSSDQEKRRSRRIGMEIFGAIKWRRQQFQVRTIDIGRHGVLLEGDVSPTERHVLRLRLATEHGPIEATAWVSRLEETQPPRIGLEFYAMSADDKSRWDHIVHDHAGTNVSSMAGGAESFMVKLRTVERLRSFSEMAFTRGKVQLQSPTAFARGTRITLHMVHPTSDEEFLLPGVVKKVTPGNPPMLDIRLERRPKLKERFDAFVEQGTIADEDPDLSWDVDVIESDDPTLLGDAPILDLELDFSEDARWSIDGVFADRERLELIIERPQQPPERMSIEQPDGVMGQVLLAILRYNPKTSSLVPGFCLKVAPTEGDPDDRYTLQQVFDILRTLDDDAVRGPADAALEWALRALWAGREQMEIPAPGGQPGSWILRRAAGRE